MTDDPLAPAAAALYRLTVAVVRSRPIDIDASMSDLSRLARSVTPDPKGRRRLIGAVRAAVTDSGDYIDAGTLPEPPDGLF